MIVSADFLAIVILATGALASAADTILPASEAVRLPFREHKGRTLKQMLKREGELTYLLPGWEFVYWRLPADLKPGQYYVGVRTFQEGKWAKNQAVDWLYHNGRQFFLDNWTPPRERREGTWMADGVCREGIALAPGDVIAVRLVVLPKVALVLRQELPVLSRLKCGKSLPWRRGDVPEEWPRIAPFIEIVRAPSATERTAHARVQIVNYSRDGRRVKVKWQLCDFFGKRFADGAYEAAAGPLSAEARDLSFTIPEDCGHAQLKVSVAEPDGAQQDSRADIVRDRTAGERPRLCLSRPGEPWQFAADGSLFLGDAPESTAFKHRRDPRHGLAGGHVGWFRRTFPVPDWLAGGRLFLHFDRVKYECKVYVNGKERGAHLGQLDPFELDITDAIRAGENELVVGIRDWVAAIDPEELRQADRSKRWADGTFRNYIAPVWGAWNYRGGIAGPVFLERRAAVHVTDAFLKPSVRKRRLEVEVTLRNTASAKVSVQPVCTIHDAGRELLRFGGAAASLAPGQEEVLTLATPFPNPPLWWPHDPHLLQARIALGDGSDALDIRFGFREVWFEGHRFMFNGRVAKIIRGNAFTRGGVMMTESMRLENVNRADETGLLWDLQTNEGIGYPTTEKLTSDRYWKNAAEMAARTARAFRNHPCVVHYNHANEFSCFSPYTNVEGNGYEVASKRLADLHEAVHRVDPTLPWHADADGDLHGHRSDFNLHYPKMNQGHHSYLVPTDIFNGFFENPRPGFAPRRGDVIRTTSNGIPLTWKFGERPACAAEVLWYAGGMLPKGVTFWRGDKVFHSTADCWEAEKERNETLVNAFRHLEMWAIHPWTCGGSIDVPADCIVPIETLRNYPSGDTVVRHVNIHHDKLFPVTYMLQWALHGPAGEEEQGREKLSLRAGALARRVIHFRLPLVRALTDVTLVMRLLEGDREVYAATQPVSIFPEGMPRIALSQPVAVWDPAGSTAPALKKLDVGLTPLEDIDAIPETTKLLLVGAVAWTDANANASAGPLFDFVERGGSLVLLRQDLWPSSAPVSLTVDQKQVSSRIWKRAPHHPVFDGIPDEWLRDWQPDHIVASGDWVKPTRGNVIPLADTGTPGRKGLDRVCLLEIRHGKGRILATQMRLTEAFDREPVAPRLLANLLKCAASPAPSLRRLAVCGKDSHPIHAFLEALRVERQTLRRPLSPQVLAAQKVILVQLDSGLTPDEASALHQKADAGALVWARGCAPETLGLLSQITGHEWQQTAEILDCWRGRALIEDDALELDGVSNEEFYWKRNVPDIEDIKYKIADLAKTHVAPVDRSAARPLIYPEDLWVVPVGKGRVLVDQVQWAEVSDKADLVPSAMRIASALLTHAGVRMQPFHSMARQPLPQNIRWETVDLSPWGTMGFADAADDDGQGGWSDQGPRMDMHRMPTGDVEYGGVPFFVHPQKGCLSMRCWYRKKIPFDYQGITIGRRALAIELLHSGAWVSTGKGAFAMKINYEDGSEVKVPFIGGINTRDWTQNPDAAFPLETDTLTRLGWTGKGDVFKTVSIWQSRWINPYPEKSIQTIDFVRIKLNQSSSGEVCASALGIVVGLTIGVEGETRPALDPVQVKKILADALSAREAGNISQAIVLARKLCAAAPNQTENWNLLGDLFLAKGDNREALKAYKKSLKANWNQPLVIEKVEKLEQN